MAGNRFITTEADVKAGGVKIFTSVEDATNADRDATLTIAKAHGFDTIHEQPESYLCGKHSTAELVEVFLDGTWEYRDSTRNKTVTDSGLTAQTLEWCLTSLEEG